MSERGVSIWTDSIAPSVSSESCWAEQYDQDLRRLIVDEKRCLLVLARNSVPGRAGARLTVQDAHDVLEDLARRGLDVRRFMPSADELVEALMASRNIVKSTNREGRKFTNRFVLIDLSQHGVIISLSIGSAKQVDADLNQPHVNWIQRLLREISPAPAGFLAKRFDRVSRTVWQTGRVIEELRAVESTTGSVWAGDVEAGRWSLELGVDALHAMRGQAALTEAVQNRRKSVRGSRWKTDHEMVDGRVFFAKAGGIPPGLFTYRERRSRRAVLAIDTPSNFPDQDDVVKPLPNVRDENGVLVDQVATIRWFLSQYGRPAVTPQVLLDGLIARRYSTHGLRTSSLHNPAAYFGGPTRPIETFKGDPADAWPRSIINNLDMYETGILHRSFGPEEDGAFAITNVFPPDGPWAQPEDFERIRRFRGANNQRAGTIFKWSWSGMPVTLDGKPAVLRGSPRRDTAEMYWRYARPNRIDRANPTQSEPGTKPTRGPRIPPIADRQLTSALVAALVEADGKPLKPFLREEPIDGALGSLQRRLASLDQQIATARQGQDVRYDQMMETDPLRAPKGRLLERIQKEYYDLEESLERLASQRKDVARRIEAATGSRVGLDATSMSALIAGLSNPYTNTYREALRDGIHNIVVTTRRFKRGKFNGVEVTLRGELVITSSANSSWVVPFSTTYDDGPAAAADERALQALARLRAGGVARFLNHGQVHASSMLAANLLGVPSTQFAIGACNEPLLLELGMAALFPGPGRGEDPAGIPRVADLEMRSDMVEAFGDVPALVRRIREVHTGRLGKQWIAQNGVKSETLALIRMATGQASKLGTAEDAALVRNLSVTLSSSLHKRPVRERWEFRRGHWPTLTPCAHCGGTAAASMRIKEVSGYLCLNPKCRRDMAGVTWPSHFDQYICLTGLWLAAGVTLDLPDDFDPNPKRLRGAPVAPIIKKDTKYRRLADIPDEERQEIARDYDERRITVVNIAAEHRVSADTIYAIARQAGLPPRNQGRAKW